VILFKNKELLFRRVTSNHHGLSLRLNKNKITKNAHPANQVPIDSGFQTTSNIGIFLIPVTTYITLKTAAPDNIENHNPSTSPGRLGNPSFNAIEIPAISG
jgi:hypothetical protein